MNSLDRTDRRILDIIQTGFPLVSRPYAEIGAATGLTEAEALARVRAMRSRGIIRRLGANFQSAKLGWRSTLCAASVPESQLETFIAEVNACPGVTHHYLRRNHYNLWFTIIAPDWAAICRMVEDLEKKTGIGIMNLPAEKLFKIRVDFSMDS
ncbi:MAG: siroheme decarboxylase subunit alpha [Desulfovibrionaceae bacterium]|nr:siroheme decarboxylase subunit alpha [Desulfovibrionaceae bacterium]